MQEREIPVSTGDIALDQQLHLEDKYDDTTFPTLVARIKALFIDILIMLAIFTAASLLIDSIGDVPGFARGFVLIFMLYLYDPLMTSLTGGTLGHKLMKLKVKRYNDPERNISMPRAFLRFIIKTALGWISFLTVTANKRKRAIHDSVSGSIMLIDK
jgi:uncharacterized RDD family membrane protein YckC